MSEPLRLIVAKSSPCIEPLCDLLLALQNQSLLTNFAFLVIGDESELDGISLLRFRNGEIDRVSLNEYERLLTRGYYVTHLVLADSFGGDISKEAVKREVAVVEKVTQRLLNARATADGAVQVTVTRVNLLVPTSEGGSFPNVFEAMASNGASLKPWINVVALAETQIEYGSPLVTFAANYQYVAHAATVLSSVAALWIDNGDLDPAKFFSTKAAGSRGTPDKCFLFRAKGRFAIAPELPIRVFSESYRREPVVPLHNEQGRFERLSDEDSRRVVNAALETVVKTHHLSVPDVTKVTALLEPQERVSLPQLLKILVKWVFKRLPKMIAEDVREKIAETRVWAEGKAAELLGDEESRLTTRDAVSHDVVQEGEELDLIARHVRPQPEIWSDVRRIVFGLVDGGEVPPGLESSRKSGFTTFVVDRHSVVPRPNGEPEVAAKSNFFDLFMQHLAFIEMQCEESLEYIRSQIEAEQERAKEEEKEIEEKREKGVLRRLTGWIAKRIFKFVVFLLACVVLVVLPFLIPIAAIVTLIWAVVGGGMICFSIVRGLFRFLRSKFLQDFRRQVALHLDTMLRAAERVLVAQQERSKSLQAIGVEWRRILGFVVHEPYGAMVKNPRPRLRNYYLELPLSFQIVEPQISEGRIKGLVEGVRQGVYGTGWLNSKYLDMRDAAEQQFKTVHGSTVFSPDDSPVSSNGDLLNHRRRLLQGVESGKVRKWIEYSARLSAQGSLLGLRAGGQSFADTLFSATGAIPGLYVGDGAIPVSSKVQEFLDSLNHGDVNPPNLELYAGNPEEMAETGLGFKKLDIIKISPRSPDKDSLEEVMSEEWVPDFGHFLFGSIAMEVSDPQEVSKLRMFSDNPTPLTIDLERAKDLWKLPPPDDVYELVPEGPDDDKEPGDVPGLPPVDDDGEVLTPNIISPKGSLTAPVGTGPYSYMLEYDGIPAWWSPSGTNPIVWRLRSKAGPKNSYEMVCQALQEVSNATGLSFVYGGSFESVPDMDSGYATTIDIGWATRSEFDRVSRSFGDYKKGIVGWGGPRGTVGANGEPIITGGRVLLNAAMNLPAEIRPGLTQYMVLLHELGHVMNLGHVQSTKEIMYPSVDDDDQISWGPGDRRGLYNLATN
jgi:hypothetical protein